MVVTELLMHVREGMAAGGARLTTALMQITESGWQRSGTTIMGSLQWYGSTVVTLQ